MSITIVYLSPYQLREFTPIISPLLSVELRFQIYVFVAHTLEPGDDPPCQGLTGVMPVKQDPVRNPEFEVVDFRPEASLLAK